VAVLAPLALLLGSVLILALGSSRRAWGRAIRASCVAGVLASPWLLPESPSWPRLALAFVGLFVFLRAVDLERDPIPRGFAFRLAFLLAFLDLRELQPRARGIDLGRIVRGAAFLALAGLGAGLAFVAAPAAPAAGLALRWGGGVMIIYGVAEAAAGLYAELLAWLGRAAPPMIDDPILARSVGRFWSERYNLVVSRWLARNVHRPFRRRGRPRLGLAAAFSASALLHVYVAWAPVGFAWALVMGAFFVVSGAAVLLERSLGVPERWPRPAQHAWALSWLLLSSPLFVEPFLRALEG
jgi:hypothetical protein